MIHSKAYTEEESYVDNIDPPEDDMKCNICGISQVSNLMRCNTNVDKKKKKPDTKGTK